VARISSAITVAEIDDVRSDDEDDDEEPVQKKKEN
jgi:hypothetical protein